MNFGDKIHQIRMSRSLTQKQFGDSLGVSGQAVSKWERNMGNPSLEVISSISKIFDVSLEQLMNEEIQLIGFDLKSKNKKKKKTNTI